MVREKPADLAILERLGAASARAKEFTGNDNWNWRYDPFLSPPKDLSSWNSGVDADLDALIDQLSGTSALALDPNSLQDALRCRNTNRLVQAFCAGDGDERGNVKHLLLLRSGRDQTGTQQLAERMSRLATTPPCMFYGHGQSLVIADVFFTHVLRHRAHLDLQASGLAASRLADQLDGLMIQSVAVQPMVLDCLLRQEPDSLFRRLNIRLPAAMHVPLGRKVFHRLGRRPIVARLNDCAQWFASHGPPRTWADVQAAAPNRSRPGIMQMPREILSYTLEYQSSHLGASNPPLNSPWLVILHLKTTTALRLLAADLASTTWPADPCDPHGLPLRPVLRDGIVIGAYSCGPDGIDQGGNRRTDWCWPLRASLGTPMAGDPPAKP